MSAAPVVDFAAVVPASHTEVVELATQRGTLLERVRTLEITDQDGLESASTILKDIKACRAVVEEKLGAPKATANKLWKQLCKVFNEADEPLATLERAIKSKIGEYHHKEQERLRLKAAEEEAAAKKADEDRRLKEAEALAAAGDTEAADQVLDEEPLPPPPARTAPPKVKGVSVGETWKAQITDMRVLIKAAAGGDSVALGILTDAKVIKAAESRAGQVAKSLKAQMKVPGVRAYAEARVSSR